MKASSILSGAAIAAIAVLGSGYLAFGVVNRDAFADFHHTTIVVNNTAGLVTGAPVLLTGVRVGVVEAIDNTAEGARVVLKVRAEQRIPIESVIDIENLSMLGETYVEITPKTAAGPYLTDGAVVAAADVRAPTSTTQMARAVARLLQQVDPAAAGRVIETFARGYDGNDDVVGPLARSTDLLAALISSRAEALGRTVSDLQRIAPDMDWTGPAMAAAAPPFVEFGDRVDEIAEAVGRLFDTGDSPRMYLEGHGLVPFLHELTAWIDSAGPDLAPIAPLLVPLRDIALQAFPRIDIGALIESAVAGLDPDAVHLRIALK